MVVAELTGPVFIGGFGRSGTHAVGGLIGADPSIHLVETEIRLHAHRGGLADLLAGRAGLEAFCRACREQWWSRGFKRPQGLRRLLEEPDFEAALGEFESGFPGDPDGSSRRLVEAVVRPALERSGKPRWAELTGRSAVAARELHRVWPGAVFVNMIRDGRAIAGGHVSKVDMTDDPLKALDGWARMVRASHVALASIPADRVLVVNLDDLVARDREGQLALLGALLGLDDLEPMRAHLDSRVTAAKAHVGGWRTRMPPPEARKVERRYLRILRGFERDGIEWFRDPRDQSVAARAGSRLPSIHRTSLPVEA